MSKYIHKSIVYFVYKNNLIVFTLFSFYEYWLSTVKKNKTNKPDSQSKKRKSMETQQEADHSFALTIPSHVLRASRQTNDAVMNASDWVCFDR